MVGKRLLLLGFLLCLPFSLWADSPPIILSDAQTIYQVVKDYPVDYLVDETSKLTAQAVASPPYADLFKPYEYGRKYYTQGRHYTLWLRFRIKNPTSQAVTLLTNIHSSRRFSIYENFNQVVQQVPVTYLFNAAKLFVPAQGLNEFYVTWHFDYRTDWWFPPFKLNSDQLNFLYINFLYQAFIALTFGILIGLLIYTLFLYLIVGDINYLLYFFVVLAIIPESLNNGNYLSSFFPNYNIFNMLFIPLSYLFLGFFYTLFAVNVLYAHLYTPKLYRLAILYLKIIPPLGFLLFILCYLGAISTWTVYQGVIGFLAPLGTYVALAICVIEVIYDLYRPARFYLFGIVIALACYLLQYLAAFGLLPYTEIGRNIGRFGITIDYILKSIVLAAYFNIVVEKEAQSRRNLISEQERKLKIQAMSLERKKSLIKSYQRFFPKQFLHLLKKKKVTDISLGNYSEKKMAILFIDMKIFDVLMEKYPVVNVFKLINRIFAEIGPIIRKFDGIVDKYVGDSTLAIFRSADDAVHASIAIYDEIEKSPELNITINQSIHFGEVTIGTIGEKERMDCTVISDTINTASRLPSLSKFYQANTIITEAALDELKSKAAIEIRYLDEVLLKGKSHPITVYEIYNHQPQQVKLLLHKIIKNYEQGIASFYVENYQEAIQCFEKCLHDHPHDKSSKMWLERSQLRLANSNLLPRKAVISYFWTLKSTL